MGSQDVEQDWKNLMPDLDVSLQKRNGHPHSSSSFSSKFITIASSLPLISSKIFIIINLIGKGDFLAVFNRDVSSDKMLKAVFQKMYDPMIMIQIMMIIVMMM